VADELQLTRRRDLLALPQEGGDLLLAVDRDRQRAVRRLADLGVDREVEAGEAAPAGPVVDDDRQGYGIPEEQAGVLDLLPGTTG
jgi:hypothetical protein